MGLLTAVPDVSLSVQELARRLTEIKHDQHRAIDARSWEMAELYVAAYARLESEMQTDRGKKPSSHMINKAIRQEEGYDGPGGSWLSHAKRLHGLWPEIFATGRKNMPYDYYLRIAICSLREPEAKLRLREWAESERPKRETLCAEIRRQVDAESGEYRPDFDLQVSNCWRFSAKTQPAEFDGGIHPELVANLLYYYTDPSSVVIDPMAGGDTTFRVTQRYRYFRERNDQVQGSGPRAVWRSDIEPRWEGVIAADVRDGLPCDDGFAHFCILDPPYFKVPSGLYQTFGETIEEWTSNMAAAISNIHRVLRDGGRLAVIVDDYLRANEFQPLAAHVFQLCLAAGFEPQATIYNTFPNFVVTMGPLQMARCKRARLLVSQVKVIHVFSKAPPPPSCATSPPPRFT